MQLTYNIQYLDLDLLPLALDKVAKPNVNLLFIRPVRPFTTTADFTLFLLSLVRLPARMPRNHS